MKPTNLAAEVDNNLTLQEDNPGKQSSECGDNDWSWTCATLPEEWNDGDDLEFTYHGALYKSNLLCEMSPFLL